MAAWLMNDNLFSLVVYLAIRIISSVSVNKLSILIPRL